MSKRDDLRDVKIDGYDKVYKFHCVVEGKYGANAIVENSNGRLKSVPITEIKFMDTEDSSSRQPK